MNYEMAKNILNEVKRLPYPQIMYVEKNRNFANMIYSDYAGEKSEFTAIMQYLFQYLNLPEYKELGKIMLAISNVEMQHMKILGELIKVLGNTPYYIDSLGKPWTASNVRYDTNDIPTMVRYNIAAEKGAIESYKRVMMYTTNKSIRNLFERIILDEKAHIQIFEGILKNFDK